MKSLSLPIPCSQEPFRLIEAIDSIYPILACGLLFFPSYKKMGFLVGAYVGAAFVFSSPSQISCLNARNQKVVFVFSVCGFKISEDLSRSSDDFCTLKVSSTFCQFFLPFVLPRDFSCWTL